MIFSEKTVSLKDGRSAILRAPDPEHDAAAILELLKTASGETEFLLRYPDEYHLTEVQERDMLEESNASPLRMMIAAEMAGELVGLCAVDFQRNEKMRHRASVSISLLKKAWGAGLGTAMFQELLDAASAYGCTQVELGVIQGNERGSALYEKLGFTVWGTLPHAFRLRDGSWRDEIMMIKYLNERIV